MLKFPSFRNTFHENGRRVELNHYLGNTKCLFCLINDLQVPPHIVAGDAIVVNTEDDSYIERLVGVI